MNTLVANFTGKVRHERLNGRDYIVAPVVLIVSGVLNGSKGRAFYPPSEIGRNYRDWNGVPLVVDHPHVNGQYVSASDPDVLRRFGIGYVYNVSFRDGKLRGEGWFDILKTRAIDPRIVANLEAQRPIEVSTGLFTDNEPAGGSFNGVQFDFIARNYQPDHLAILPDKVGACSLSDGCGVLANRKRGLTDEQAKWVLDKAKRIEELTMCANEENDSPLIMPSLFGSFSQPAYSLNEDEPLPAAPGVIETRCPSCGGSCNCGNAQDVAAASTAGVTAENSADTLLLPRTLF